MVLSERIVCDLQHYTFQNRYWIYVCCYSFLCLWEENPKYTTLPHTAKTQQRTAYIKPIMNCSLLLYRLMWNSTAWKKKIEITGHTIFKKKLLPTSHHMLFDWRSILHSTAITYAFHRKNQIALFIICWILFGSSFIVLSVVEELVAIRNT